MNAPSGARGPVVRETGTPWVAEYRDPWTAVPNFGRRNRPRRILDRRMDRSVVAGAHHVVVTAESAREAFLKAFRELSPERIGVVRNGWDNPASTTASPPPPHEPLSLVYSGSLLDARWAVPFLDALAAVDATDPGSVTLDVWGPREAWTQACGSRGGLPSFVRLHGMTSGEEAAAKLRGASALVVLQPDAAVYVPGKVYDSLAKRP